MNILVVEDDIVQLESLARGLRTKGHRVLEASDADEALQRFKDTTDTEIELVLADYMLPGMNGMRLLKKIREIYGSVPTILMTAFADENLLIEAWRNQLDSFIEKPFTPDQLIQEIERVSK